MPRRRSKLARAVQLDLIHHFCAGATARAAARASGVNRNTVILFFHKLREVIFGELVRQEPGSLGTTATLDEAGMKTGNTAQRSAAWGCKIPAFGLFHKSGKIHVVIPLSMATSALTVQKTATVPAAAARAGIKPHSVVFYADDSGKSHTLDIASLQHVRVHSTAALSNQEHAVDSFWNQCQLFLKRYNGIPKSHFHLFLKECEWRFNCASAGSRNQTLQRWCFCSH